MGVLIRGLMVVICLLALLLKEGVPTRSNESLLVEDLLSQYGPASIRPVRFQESVCHVYMRFIITHVISLDERDQEMTVSGWMKYIWVDEYLQWDASQTNVDLIRVDVKRIWRPDITLYNDVEGKLKSTKTNLPATVYPDGTVEWSSPAIFISSCIMNVRYFPFDTQSCPLEFGSWAYEGHEVQLDVIEEDEDSQTEFAENGIWELKEVIVNPHIRTASGTYDYSIIKMSLILKRRHEFYVSNIIIPCVLLSCMSTLVYLMPPDCGEKISYGITLVLSLLVFQQLISENLPPVADGSPILGNYFTFVITMGCLSMLVASIVLNIYCGKNVRPPPRWVESFFLGKLGRYIGRYRRKEQNHQHNGTQSHIDTDHYLNENGDNSINETELDSKLESTSNDVTVTLRTETGGPDEILLGIETCGPDDFETEVGDTTYDILDKWIHVSIVVDRLLLICSVTIVIIAATIMLTVIVTQSNN